MKTLINNGTAIIKFSDEGKVVKLEPGQTYECSEELAEKLSTSKHLLIQEKKIKKKKLVEEEE